MTVALKMTRSQAQALSKLILVQVASYAEADELCAEEMSGENNQRSVDRRDFDRFGDPCEPFTGEDLDALVPLLVALGEIASC